MKKPLFEEIFYLLTMIISSAMDNVRNIKVAIKKLARPFQSAIHAKRTYRELRLLKHMNHENVRYINITVIFTIIGKGSI